MSISLTQPAAEHIQRSFAKTRRRFVGLRFGVRLTGCSGLAYKLDFVDEAVAGDQLFEEHGVKLFVDPKSLPFIDGTRLDYGRDGLNEGFKFINPNEKASCGCGRIVYRVGTHVITFSVWRPINYSHLDSADAALFQWLRRSAERYTRIGN